MNITKEQMDKIKLGGIVVICVLVFLGVIYIASEYTGDRSMDKSLSNIGQSQAGQGEENPLLQEGEVLREEEQKELISMSMEDLRNTLNNKEKKFVMLGTETCHWCVYQKPILKAIAYQYDIELYYMDLNQLSGDEYSELTTLHESLEKFGTPTFIIVQDGKVVEVSIGGMTTTEASQLLARYEFVK